MDYPKRKLIMLPGPTNVPDRVMDAMIKPMINHRSPNWKHPTRRDCAVEKSSRHGLWN